VTTGGSAVDRARHGDRAAWRALVDQHLGLVHAICRGHGLRPEAAAEVNQVVWLQLVEHLSRIRAPEAIGGWIAATARSQCLGPRRTADRSGYAVADIGFGLVDARGDGNGHGAGNGHEHGSGNGHGPGNGHDRSGTNGHGNWNGVDPNGNSNGNGRGPVPPAAQGQDVAAAFARLGAHCQRLLRLAVIEPAPSAEDISAALDIPTDEVDPACQRCLDRLRRLVSATAGADAVAAELADLVASREPVPAGWSDAADVAFAWLVIDAGAAARVYDSVTGDGMQEVHHVRFSARDSARDRDGARDRARERAAGVELALDSNGDEVLLSGRLTTGRSDPVTVLWPGGERTVIADETGSFRVHGLPVAPLCVHVAGPDPLKTGWMLP
jgi:DNA-directed RNA polymerase specialized sigma24 family protein